MDLERFNQVKYNLRSVDLIKLVFERPCLWDKSVTEYRNKTIRDAAWTEIYRQLDDDYDSLTPVMKRHVGNMIYRKWCNIRDAYVKARKTSDRDRKPYVHEKRLTFLEPFISERQDNDKDSDQDWTDDSTDEDEPVAKKIKCIKDEDNEPENIKIKFNVSSMELIQLIRDRPCLWDKSMSVYKDKTARDAAWLEIYQKVDPDYDALSPLVKKHVGSLITKKWYNIRDTYVKARNNYRVSRRPYVYTTLLRFLDPFLTEKQRERTKENHENKEEEEIWFNDVYIQDESPKKDTLVTIKEEETSQEETDLLSVLTRIIQKEEDEDRAFFKSIEPSVKSLSEESKLDFRIQVLKLIRNLKMKDKTGVRMSLDMSADSN